MVRLVIWDVSRSLWRHRIRKNDEITDQCYIYIFKTFGRVNLVCDFAFRIKILRSGKTRQRKDGYNSAVYKVNDYTEHPLYTNISTELTIFNADDYVKYLNITLNEKEKTWLLQTVMGPSQYKDAVLPG